MHAAVGQYRVVTRRLLVVNLYAMPMLVHPAEIRLCAQ